MDRRLAATFVLLACATVALFSLARAAAFGPVLDLGPVSGVVLAGAVLVVSVPLAMWTARSMSRPFRQLAVAAEDLGRGRFDVTVPRSSVPEVREIGAALEGAAHSFELRLREQKVFLERASHVIRTPLTGIRLELEDLLQRTDDPDVRDSVQFCVGQVEKLDHDAGTVLAWAREWTAAGQPVADLDRVARHVSARWADRMVDYDSEFRSFVDGDTAVEVVPGLVEQVLDQVLEVVLHHGYGTVRLSFTGLEAAIRVEVLADGPVLDDDLRLRNARMLAETLGGSMDGTLFSPSGLKILLPGR